MAEHRIELVEIGGAALQDVGEMPVAAATRIIGSLCGRNS
jgi:hypothetical protein